MTGSVPPAAAYRASPGAAVIAARTAVKSCANQLAEHFTERRRPVRTRFAPRLSETIRTSAAGECRRCQAQWQYRYIDERRTGRRQQHANFFYKTAIKLSTESSTKMFELVVHYRILRTTPNLLTNNRLQHTYGAAR